MIAHLPSPSVPMPMAAEPIRVPYPGLRPFDRDEADVFFGREEQTDELLRRLDSTRFLAIVGPSGCGKSSLFRAGMIAALETGFMVRAGVRWRVALMQPGADPMMNLAVALQKDSAMGPERPVGEDSLALLHATLRRGPLGLVDVLNETPLPDGTNLLLGVDQFEELFRFHREGNVEEAQSFVALLLESAARRTVPIYVVITMRSEYIGKCAIFSGLPEVLNDSQYLTPRLTREQQYQAIVGPAKVFGGNVKAELANCIINEMGSDPAQLPVMQHVLMRMWRRTQSPKIESDGNVVEWPQPISAATTRVRSSNVLTLDDYKAVGGLAGAISQHANEAFDKLDQEQKRVAHILFCSLCERTENGYQRRPPTPIAEIASVADTTPAKIIEVADEFRDPSHSFLVPPLPKTRR